MAHREQRKLHAPAGEQGIVGDEQGIGPLAPKSREGRLDFAARAIGHHTPRLSVRPPDGHIRLMKARAAESDVVKFLRAALADGAHEIPHRKDPLLDLIEDGRTR